MPKKIINPVSNQGVCTDVLNIVRGCPILGGMVTSFFKKCEAFIETIKRIMQEIKEGDLRYNSEGLLI